MTTQTSTSDARNGVKTDLTAKRRRSVENPEYAAMVRRIISAHGKRIAEGDIEGLRELVDLAASLNDAIANAVIGLRDFGFSWGDVAARLGVSKQAAQQRWTYPAEPDRRSIDSDLREATLFDDLDLFDQSVGRDDWEGR